ncbi:MAG: bifunctional metallophosphatase/5'-nucleotidase [Candidatus Marinimicrobia bacterium]|nr:bifunctional metallophosphatase/5'-nucleotidase [Candidatus Neomarinimicrobiota bacterium]MCF7827985.1 bifunctional metallophosphatase/5'-nucleotidase [Candidatus Neomarinimicrobiota bacterium]MCF7879260.1 bifunctional metallophosphatase/5'-nucleotidase [Candidatus Neomarinimicrobiota bacterium]
MGKKLNSNLFFAITVSLLVFFPGTGSAQTVETAFIHWNDFHAYNQYKVTSDGDTVGGYAYLAAYRDSLEALHPGNSFSLHAGDDFQGTPISTFTKGASQIQILNLVQPEAFVLGNHEFDYGRQNLDSLLRIAAFPTLAANLLDIRTGKTFAPPTTMLRGKSAQIGVIGLVPPNLYGLTLPENVEDLKVLDQTAVVKEYVKSLESQVDLTVVLSHMGFSKDSLLATSLGSNTTVDLIVGGHSHTTLRHPREVNGIPILQAGDHGQYLGHAVTNIDTVKNRIVSLNYELIPIDRSGVVPNPAVQSLVDSFTTEAKEELDEVIATLKTPWKREYDAESNIGNWQADVMRDYADADIAFQNSGGIRKDLPAGPVKVRDIWEINPFGNHFVRFEVTGADLQTILKHQITDPKEFLQLSGLQYTWDKSERRFTRALVDRKNIDETVNYSIVTNNYVFSHFEDFFGFPQSTISAVKHLPDIDRDVFLRAAARQDTIDSRVQIRAEIVK